ncbi:MAG: tRNA (adenosine(37)-N6)-threonylcarbamoyltransferase complex ATPase subunit type 1 TsaE [Candidatus Kuenenia sp.]|nr:tRNA (adenosine(37)-N6)-threonylcarbamoyltransferase complex ATPase subunit type 1 TsaE [Candidatus Kuenenia hertensis]
MTKGNRSRTGLLVSKNSKITFVSKSTAETIAFGVKLGKLLTNGHVIALIGELGAGKTTMTKGIVGGLDAKDKDKVKSPTFSLVHKYDGRIPVYHIDAYRLSGSQELLEIGSDEIVFGDGVTIIEWADIVPESLPENYLKITLTHVSEDQRIIEICGYGKHYEQILQQLKN